jgi:rhamnose utilization protein RhaD (predicted bifunctional aldolase and dehydrogenase)/NAD(P)-dependent dehydrogenase (short-subunit alcohol dehydrogenase family)
MENRWSEDRAAEFVDRYGPKWGVDLALRTYSSRLLGAEKSLVLHGGGNTSVKGTHTNILGEHLPALFVKASGYDMAVIEPEGHPGLDLSHLRKLRRLAELSDSEMVNEFRTHLFDFESATPSIETLVHAFLPPKFIDHTHAGAVLALTNQPDGETVVRDALGERVIVLRYVKPGFKLAKAVAEAFEANPGCRAMVWIYHGLLTWGDTARDSYNSMIELVARAEDYLTSHASRPLTVVSSTPLPQAEERLKHVAPVLRGLLAQPASDSERPHRSVILRPLVNRESLDFVDSELGKELALSPPLTSDYLIRTKAFPLWIDSPAYEDSGKLRDQLSKSVNGYAKDYDAYITRQSARMGPGVARLDSLPRVILMPGLGVFCAGKDATESGMVRDITAHTLSVKAQVAAMGTYRGLPESDLFDMEYDLFQHAKLKALPMVPLGGRVAVVTGAAGAIGSAIAQRLLEDGCCVAVTDLPGDNLSRLTHELRSDFGDHIIGLALDVADPESVSQAYGKIVKTWGGLDLVVVNAGVALVSSLAEMDLVAFRKLERVNIEGTLLILAESARLFERQGTGGDIVLVSTKNVFAPGAQFGAYSATKAAAHQLARIASLELAGIGVRVNMVAPDAVFGHGTRKSGLWAEVGPDRMRARGLDERGLEEYYRNRNLLKARVTAEHVANAVLYFATRQTPTTGATLPVDGGLPEATPR